MGFLGDIVNDFNNVNFTKGQRFHIYYFSLDGISSRIGILVALYDKFFHLLVLA